MVPCGPGSHVTRPLVLRPALGRLEAANASFRGTLRPLVGTIEPTMQSLAASSQAAGSRTQETTAQATIRIQPIPARTGAT